MPYDSNLSLPICPKCRDTKNIEKRQEHSVKMTYTEYKAYECKECNLYWNTCGFIEEGNNGTN